MAPQFVLENAKGKVFSNADFKDKIIVIDFWTTSCGQCFKKFPIVETLNRKVKGRSDILIFSVNNQLRDDTKEKAVEMIRKRGYTFDVLFSDLELTNKQFNFNGYPMVFIIQNGERIIYRGSIDHVESVLNL